MLQTLGLKVFNRPVNHLVEKLTTKQQCWQPDLVSVVTPAIAVNGFLCFKVLIGLCLLMKASDWLT